MKKRTIVLGTAAALSVMMSVPAFAGTWMQDPARPANTEGVTNWWYQNTDGSYAKEQWLWIDGNKDGISECYRFDPSGWLYVSTQIDGYEVNEAGAWVVNGQVQTKKEAIETTRRTSSKSDDDDDDERETTSSRKKNSSAQNNSQGSSQNQASQAADDSDAWDDIWENANQNQNHSVDQSEFAEACFDLINEERRKQGIAELELDSTLQEACDIRAEELVEKFSHTRPDGTNFDSVFDEVGFEDAGLWGENIAAGQRTPEAAVKSWMNSAGHKKNILTKGFKRGAIGFYYAPGTAYQYFWVQIFAD